MGDILNSITAAQNQVPVINERGAMPQIEIPGAIPNPVSQVPADPNGDVSEDIVTAMKLKKRNIWEILGDAMIINSGGDAEFAKGKHRQNMERAMEGFTHDPLTSIRNMARVNPEKAWQMYGQHQDDARANRVEERQFGTAGDKVRVALGGYLGAIAESKDPATAYQKMLPLLRKLEQRGGATDIMLPDVYDEDTVRAWARGAISPKDQLSMELLEMYRQQRLRQGDRGLDIREEATDSLIEHRDESRGERARHNQVTEGQGQQRINNRGGGGTRPVNTRLGPGTMNADGSRLIIHRPNGEKWQYENRDGRSIRVGVIKPEGAE